MQKVRLEKDEVSPDQTHVFIGTYEIGWFLEYQHPDASGQCGSYSRLTDGDRARFHKNRRAALRWLRREAISYVAKHKSILKELGELE